MLNPFTHRKILKKGMPGRATIFAVTTPARGAWKFNLGMTLQVHVEGLAPYEVEDSWIVFSNDPVGWGNSLPVKVDRDDQTRVAIDWKAAREEAEQRKTARREALAKGGVRGLGASLGGAQVIDARSNPELRKQVEQMLGQIGASVPAGSGGSRGGPGGAAGADTISQLERLAALRASGALTEEEFEEQKNRLLGG